MCSVCFMCVCVGFVFFFLSFVSDYRDLVDMRTVKYECWMNASSVRPSIVLCCQAFELCRVSMTVYFQSRAGIKSNFSCLMQPLEQPEAVGHLYYVQPVNFVYARSQWHTDEQRVCKKREKKRWIRKENICCCRFWAPWKRIARGVPTGLEQKR